MSVTTKYRIVTPIPVQIDVPEKDRSVEGRSTIWLPARGKVIVANEAELALIREQCPTMTVALMPAPSTAHEKTVKSEADAKTQVDDKNVGDGKPASATAKNSVKGKGKSKGKDADKDGKPQASSEVTGPIGGVTGNNKSATGDN